jgi:hypothetical protein
MKPAWIVFLTALILALAGRIYQLFFLYNIKEDTYKYGNLSSIIILSLLALSILLILILCFTKKNAPKEYKPIKNVPTAIICMLTGAAVILNSFVHMMDNKENVSTSLSIVGTAASSGQLYVMQVFLALFGILAGLVILITAYNFLQGVNMFHNFPLVALIPPLWGCISLAVLFVTDTASVDVAENAFDMFTVIFTLLFLFAQSRLFAGIDVEKNTKSVYMFGLPCILLSLVTSVAGAAFGLMHKGYANNMAMTSYLMNFCMAVYVLLFLISVQSGQAPVQKHLQAKGAKHVDPSAKPIRKL